MRILHWIKHLVFKDEILAEYEVSYTTNWVDEGYTEESYFLLRKFKSGFNQVVGNKSWATTGHKLYPLIKHFKKTGIVSNRLHPKQLN